METTTKEQTMSQKQWDNLYFAILEGTDRDEMVKTFGESSVAFAEKHPVVKAALAYRNK